MVWSRSDFVLKATSEEETDSLINNVTGAIHEEEDPLHSDSLQFNFINLDNESKNIFKNKYNEETTNKNPKYLQFNVENCIEILVAASEDYCEKRIFLWLLEWFLFNLRVYR